MNKKSVILSAFVGIVPIGIITSYSSTSIETINLDMGRTHVDVFTAMGSPTLGDPSAPITIVEFGDFQCHACYNWFHNSKPAIYENYIANGKANLVFVDLAFLGRDSPIADQTYYCAEDQEKYWDYHDLLYDSQDSKIDNGWDNSESLKNFAFSLGLDMELFESCFDSDKYSKMVHYNLSVAKKHDAKATPTFIIVGPDEQQVQNQDGQPYSTFKQIMDNMI